MKRILLLISALLVSICCGAQGWLEGVLREVESNNPELKAMAAEVEAERIANRGEALLQNPEVEFGQLWGAEGIGNRHDVRVSQPFDVATISGLRAGKAATLDEISYLKYRAGRIEILLDAWLTCIDLVHCNALLSELSTHLSQAGTLVEACQKKLAAGEATVLDLNKAKIHLTSVQGQVNSLETLRNELMATLRSLNGGIDIPFDHTVYDIGTTLPESFEEWYESAAANNPLMEYARAQVSLEERQLAIDKASRLPEFSLGYMSEIRTVEKFRGVTVGVSVPLWSAANKVRRSKAGLAAAESRKEASEKRFRLELEKEYARALALKANAEMTRSSLAETDNRDFLLTALTKGEISMVDYLVETDLYYETLERTLETERDYRKAVATLQSVCL